MSNIALDSGVRPTHRLERSSYFTMVKISSTFFVKDRLATNLINRSSRMKNLREGSPKSVSEGGDALEDDETEEPLSGRGEKEDDDYVE